MTILKFKKDEKIIASSMVSSREEEARVKRIVKMFYTTGFYFNDTVIICIDNKLRFICSEKRGQEIAQHIIENPRVFNSSDPQMPLITEDGIITIFISCQDDIMIGYRCDHENKEKPIQTLKWKITDVFKGSKVHAKTINIIDVDTIEELKSPSVDNTVSKNDLSSEKVVD